MEDQSPDGKFRQLDILPFLDGGALRDRQLQLRLPGGTAAGVSRSCDAAGAVVRWDTTVEHPPAGAVVNRTPAGAVGHKQ